MWEDLVIKAKNGGLDVIDTYVFWNVHEPSPGIVSSVNRGFFSIKASVVVHFKFC